MIRDYFLFAVLVLPMPWFVFANEQQEAAAPIEILVLNYEEQF